MDTDTKRPSTPRSVAARNGLGVTTIYAEIKSGRLVARKLNTRTLILPDDERAWLDALPRLSPQPATAAPEQPQP